MARETCSNVTSYQCLSPANLVPQRYVRAHCWVCGDAVCIPCSQVVTNRETFGPERIRVCDNCMTERGGDWAARVVQKHHRQAGYVMSLPQARREAILLGSY